MGCNPTWKLRRRNAPEAADRREDEVFGGGERCCSAGTRKQCQRGQPGDQDEREFEAFQGGPTRRGDFQGDGGRISFSAGRRPHSNRAAMGYVVGMNILLLMVVLLLLFGGGGFYLGGPVIGGSGLGLVLLICLVVFIMGGFRPTKSGPANQDKHE